MSMRQRESSQWLISDEEDDEPVPNLIPQDSSSSDNEDKPQAAAGAKLNLVLNVKNYVAMEDVEDRWWENLVAEVPRELQCRIGNCRLAPKGHRRHEIIERFYTLVERRVIIQYLIHYDDIINGKGLRVWEDMHARGYLSHRPVESLNNHFKRYILRDIETFKLPRDIEAKFLELRN